MDSGRHFGWFIRLGFLFFILILLAAGGYFFCRICLNMESAECPSEKKTEKKILLVVSYHMTHPWTSSIVSQLLSESKKLPWRLEYNVIVLNAISEQDSAVWDRTILRQMDKIRARHYDLIVTLDHEATDRVLKLADQIPADIPMLFSGCENFDPDMLKRHPNITGLIQQYDIPGNIQLGKKLWPNAKEVVLLYDSSPGTIRYVHKLQAKLPKDPALTITWLDSRTHSLPQLLAILEQKKNAFFILIPWHSLSNSDYQTLEAIAIDIAKHANKPFFVSEESLIGYGAIGGRITPASVHAEETLTLITRVLNAGKASGIPVQTGSLQAIFDHRKLLAEKLDPEVLPPETFFLNRPPSIWETHPERILGFGAFFLFLILLLIGWVIYLLRLHELNRKSLSVFEVLPVWTGVLDEKENILFFKPEDGKKSDIKKLSELPGINYTEVSAVFREIFETNIRKSFEYEFQNRKRAVSAAPLPVELFGKKAVIWISYDNTELQEIREQFEKSTALFRCVLDHLPCYLLVKDLNCENRYLLTSRMLEKGLGAEPGGLIGKRDADLYSGEVLRNYQDDDNAAREKPGETIRFIREIQFNGEKRMILNNKTVFHFGSSDLLICTGIDITAQEESRHKLEEANRLWDTVINGLPFYVFAKDGTTFRYTLANRAFARDFTGMRPEQLIGKDDYELFPEKEAAQFRRMDEASLLRNSPNTFMERTKGGDNQFRILRTSKQPFLLANGKKLILGTSVNLTRETLLLETEQALGKSLQRIALGTDFRETLRSISENFQKRLPSDRIVIAITQGPAEEWSVEFEWTLPSLPRLDLLSAEQQIRLFAGLRKDLEENRIVQGAGLKLNLPGISGIGLTAVPVFAEGHLSGCILVSLPATDGERSVLDEEFLRASANIISLALIRKKQIDSLNANRTMLNSLLNHLPVGVIVKDVDHDFRYLMANPYYCQHTGQKEEDILGKTDAEIQFSHQRAEILRKEDADVVASGEVLRSTEENYYPKVGRVIYERFKLPLNLEDNRHLLLVTYSDITVMHNLLESERITKQSLAQIAMENNFEKNLDSIIQTLTHQMNCDRVILAKAMENGTISVFKDWCGPDLSTMQNFDPDLLTGNLNAFLPRLQDNRLLLIPNISESTEFRISGKFPEQSLLGAPVFINGVFWGAVFVSFARYARTITTVDEDILRSTAYIIAISLIRTRQSEALSESRALLQSLLDNLPVAIVVKDPVDNYRYLMCNPAYCRMIGRTEADLLGKSDEETGIILPEHAMKLRMLDRQCLEEGNVMHSMETFNFPHSGRKSYERFKIPIQLSSGRNLLLVSYMDVTTLNNFVESERIMNTSLAHIALETDFRKNVDMLLNTLAGQLECDGVGLAVYHPGRNAYELLREWIIRNALPLMNRTPEYITQLMMIGHSKFIQRNVFMLSDVENTPEAILWKELGTRSLIAAPIFLEGALWGVVFVGFRGYKRIFSNIDEGIMASMANMISIARMRQRQMEEIHEANREKQMILDNIRIPIWLYDANGILLRQNTAASAMLGHSEQKRIAGKQELEIQKEENAPVLQTRLNGQPASCNYRSGNRDYILYAEPVRSSEGNLINIVKSAVDVTEINKYTRNERILNGCMRTLLSSDDPETVILPVLETICRHLSADRCMITAIENERISLRYEYRLPELPPLPTDFPPRPFSKKEIWYRKLASGEVLEETDLSDPHTFSNSEMWKDSIREEKIKSLYGIGIFLNDQLWGGFTLVYEQMNRTMDERDLKFFQAVAHLIEIMLERDFSHRKLLAALEQARAADKAKSFFLASMSHEIRTPLNAVIGFSELLKDDQLERKTQRDYVDSISRAGNALLDLINDVLDLSKLEAGQMVFTPTKTNFKQLSEDVFLIFRRKLEEKNLSYSLTIPPMPPIYVDSHRIRQILFNLVGNAVKFTEKGSVRLESVFLKYPNGVGSLIFKIIDTGIGITKEDSEILFQPFIQAKAMRGTHAANSGTGLGLAIIRRLLHEMNGTITLESEVGKGSCFTVRIDALRYEAQSPDSASAPPAQGATALGIPPVPVSPFAGKTILLVDDVSMNLKVLNAMLRKMEIRTISTSSGTDALKQLKKHSVDLVLTDLWMPAMSGAELAENIRRANFSVPIVALTADVESNASFDVSVFDDVLTKPVTVQKLQALFGKLSGKSSPRTDRSEEAHPEPTSSV